MSFWFNDQGRYKQLYNLNIKLPYNAPRTSTSTSRYNPFDRYHEGCSVTARVYGSSGYRCLGVQATTQDQLVWPEDGTFAKPLSIKIATNIPSYLHGCLEKVCLTR